MASGPITALDVGARRVGIPQTTGLAELRAAALSARCGQALRGPSMICGHRARVATGAALAAAARGTAAPRMRAADARCVAGCCCTSGIDQCSVRRHCSIDIRVQRRCRCTNSCVQAAPDACNPWLRSYSTGLRCRARAFQRRLGDSWRGEKLPRMPGVQSALLCFAPAPEFAALSVESADQLLSCGSS